MGYAIQTIDVTDRIFGVIAYVCVCVCLFVCVFYVFVYVYEGSKGRVD